MRPAAQKKELFFPVLILLGFLTAGCQSLQVFPGKTPPPETFSLIESYFKSDPEDSGLILQKIAEKDFREMEHALRYYLTHRYEETVPVGTRPGRSIHVGAERMTYGLFVPPSYNPKRAYPLIICLHGAGFSGDAYLDRWKPRLGDDFILACPSIRGGSWWTPNAEILMKAVINDVSTHYRINTDRVFLTGMSNGGNGTFLLGLNYADRFAALVPMAGAFPNPLYPLLENARTLPIYMIHGSRDHIIPVEYSRNVAEHLKKSGRSFVYSEHDRVHHLAGGHFFPHEELPGLIKWLKKKRRVAIPNPLVIVRDRDHSGRIFWIRFEEISKETGSVWASEYYPEEERKLREGAYAWVEAEATGNRITLTAVRVNKLSLLLHPELVDFSRPVEINVNGKTVYQGLIQPSLKTLMTEARLHPDPRQLVWAAIDIPVSL